MDLQPAAVRCVVRVGRSLMILKLSEIRWFESDGNHVVAHASSNTYRIRSTIQRIENRFEAAGFLRVHRSTVINLYHISEVRRAGRAARDFVAHLLDGKTIRVSRTYAPQLLRSL